MEAAMSCGRRPWHSDSPQPVMFASVMSSTIMVLRRLTQPMEKANGTSSGVDRAWVLMSTMRMRGATLNGLNAA